MAVREFIVNTHPRTYDWNIILKDDKKNTLAQIIIYKYLGARQSEPNVLTENKFFDDLYPRMMKLDFRNENKIVITFGLEATSDENYKKTKIEYDVNPILYNKILDYLRGLPIGLTTFRDGSQQENHLIEIKLDSDNSSSASASASASASNINRLYGGKRKSIKTKK
jgi:hypothetical protein